MSAERLIPTLVMEREPRLRRMFALVGRVLHDGTEDSDTEDALADVLMEIAPEFVPPYEGWNMAEWEQLVGEALGERKAEAPDDR